MLSGRTFQREGATYLKARSPYRFVLESLGPGTSRRDIDADLRGEKGFVFGEDHRGGGGGGGGGGVVMNWPVSGRENFVADPFLDGKPIKLSENGWSSLRNYICRSFLFFIIAYFCYWGRFKRTHNTTAKRAVSERAELSWEQASVQVSDGKSGYWGGPCGASLHCPYQRHSAGLQWGVGGGGGGASKTKAGHAGSVGRNSLWAERTTGLCVLRDWWCLQWGVTGSCSFPEVGDL